ncbi:MAG: CBS domain-containing protein [Candidatus Wallbacteria bacterium]|nr:CBS domain-containing protein [Candidatus Wallbacteria bacterium]
MLVRDLMSKTVIALSESDPLPRAIALMRENRIRRLPVVRDGKLAGIVTDRDLREYMPSKATDLEAHELRYLIEKTPVSAVMKRQVLTVPSDTTIEQAAAIMRKEKIGGFPVVDDGQMVGIITESDIFEAMVELLGAHDPGARFTLDLGVSATALRDVLDVVKEYSPQVICSVTYSSEDLPKARNLVLKVKVDRHESEVMRNRFEQMGLTILDSRFDGSGK